jgi:hypothetical protein
MFPAYLILGNIYNLTGFLPRGQFVEKMPRILIVFYRNEDKISSSQEVIKNNRIWGEFDQW